MPSFEERDFQQPMQLGQMELLQNQPSPLKTLASEVYDWTMNHKLEVGAVIGLAALAGGAARLISSSRAAMAEFYGPGAVDQFAMKSLQQTVPPGNLAKLASEGELLPKIAIENSGASASKAGLVVDNSDAAMGANALNAKLHEIPTFSDMPWDKLKRR